MKRQIGDVMRMQVDEVIAPLAHVAATCRVEYEDPEMGKSDKNKIEQKSKIKKITDQNIYKLGIIINL